LEEPAFEPLVFALIDDDAALRRVLAAVIRQSGDLAIEARTFAEGQVLLAEYPWDIALVDRSLPDGDGLEFCRSLDKGEASHRMIVVLSSRGEREDRLAGFEAGADEYFPKVMDLVEIRTRLKTIRRAVARHKEIVSRLVSVEQMSLMDGLTGVYNHRYFEGAIKRQFGMALRHQRPLTLAMIDIDNFKHVNDSLGHLVGDRVLTEVSTVIAQHVRSTDELARYGGEEFAILMPDLPLREALPVAERIRVAVAGHVTPIALGDVKVTVSIGLAGVPCDFCLSPAELTDAADRALYSAKAKGRNRVEVFAPNPASTSAAGNVFPRVT
jgi:two-component system cell cycle response regulator